jgi:hypothetical protein
LNSGEALRGTFCNGVEIVEAPLLVNVIVLVRLYDVSALKGTRAYSAVWEFER